MPTYKLSYFNGRGRGETARILFASAGVKFEDHRIEMADWPKIKPTTPQGQLPILTVDGKLLHQSSAINQYLATKFGFMGGCEWEAGLINETVEVGSDLFRPSAEATFTQSETRKAELTKSIAEVILPKTLQILEARLKANGSNGFLVGGKLSLADIYTFMLLQPLLDDSAKAAAFKDHGAIKEHVKRIGAVPAIKKYLDSRPNTFF